MRIIVGPFGGLVGWISFAALTPRRYKAGRFARVDKLPVAPKTLPNVA
jgi:hypothetical protein